MPEVLLQSTLSRSVASLSKEKQVNAHGHNSATHYFDDKTVVHFIAESLLYPAVPITRF